MPQLLQGAFTLGFTGPNDLSPLPWVSPDQAQAQLLLPHPGLEGRPWHDALQLLMTKHWPLAPACRPQPSPQALLRGLLGDFSREKDLLHLLWTEKGEEEQ